MSAITKAGNMITHYRVLFDRDEQEYFVQYRKRWNPFWLTWRNENHKELVVSDSDIGRLENRFSTFIKKHNTPETTVIKTIKLTGVEKEDVSTQ